MQNGPAGPREALVDFAGRGIARISLFQMRQFARRTDHHRGTESSARRGRSFIQTGGAALASVILGKTKKREGPSAGLPFSRFPVFLRRTADVPPARL